MGGSRMETGTTEAAEDVRHVPSPRTRLHLFAPLSTRVFNPLTRLVAGRLPGLGVLTHTGRRTRRRYRTPLLVLRRGDDYVVALWYGSDVHWVKNVLGRAAASSRPGAATSGSPSHAFRPIQPGASCRCRCAGPARSSGSPSSSACERCRQ